MTNFVKTKNMSTESKSGGISLAGVLFIVFLILKLTGNIDWSWWWVTAPLWLPFLVGVGLFIIYLLLVAIFD